MVWYNLRNKEKSYCKKAKNKVMFFMVWENLGHQVSLVAKNICQVERMNYTKISISKVMTTMLFKHCPRVKKTDKIIDEDIR